MVIYFGRQALFSQIIEKTSFRRIENKVHFAQPFVTDGRVVLLRSSDPDFQKKLWVESYADSLQYPTYYKLSLSGSPGKACGTFLTKNATMVFRSVYSLVQGVNILYLDLYGVDYKWLRTAEICRSPLKNYGDKGDFLVTASPSGNYFFCYYTQLDDYGSEIIHLIGMDEVGKVNYRNTLPSLYQSQNAELIQLECDDLGRAFLLFREPGDLKGLSSEQMRYSLCLVGNSENNMQVMVIDSGYKDISDLYLTITAGKWALAGFYHSKRRTGLEGFVHIRGVLDTFKITLSQFVPFSESFRQELTGAEFPDRQSMMRDYTIHKAYINEDQKLVMLAEKIYTNQQNYVYPGTMQTTYRTVYNYNEIVIFEADSGGLHLRQKVIKKNQSTTNDGGIYSGFVFGEVAGEYLFYFNAIEKGQRMVKEYRYAPNGLLSDREMNEFEVGAQLLPGSSIQLKDQSILMMVHRDGMEEQLFRVYYNK